MKDVWITLLLAASGSVEVDAGAIIDGTVTTIVAGGSIYLLGKLAISGQWQLIKAGNERNKSLESRLDDLEGDKVSLSKRLDKALEGHRQCEDRLAAHQREAASEWAAMQMRIGELERIIERRGGAR